jgi:HSP20 family protein
MSPEASIAERKQEVQPSGEFEATRSRPTFLPCANIHEREDSIMLIVEMPGVRQEDVEVNLEADKLTIVGHVAATAIEGHELSYAEYEVGDYERRFRISGPIDTGHVEASMKNGVLRIVLKKSKKAAPHKINVQAG